MNLRSEKAQISILKQILKQWKNLELQMRIQKHLSSSCSFVTPLIPGNRFCGFPPTLSHTLFFEGADHDSSYISSCFQAFLHNTLLPPLQDSAQGQRAQSGSLHFPHSLFPPRTFTCPYFCSSWIWVNTRATG